MASSPILAPSTKNSTLETVFSASVASAVNVTWPGVTAAFSAGDVIFTSGRVSGERPLPLNSMKFRRKFAAPLNTRNRPIDSVLAGAGIVTSCQRLELPVDGTAAVPSSSPVGESLRSSIEPPAVVEATRKVTLLMPVKFTGSYEAHLPSPRPPRACVGLSASFASPTS